MAPLLAGSLVELAGTVFDRIFPNPEEKAKAQLELFKMQQEGAFKELDLKAQNQQAQMNVNAIEAANPNQFVSGWRPFIGWICGFGLLYQFLLRPILSIVCQVQGWPVAVPDLDMETLGTLLAGMLGLSWMRTTEKKARVTR